MEYELCGNHAYNINCMELLRGVPDKYFDLACVDVPYGIGEGGQKQPLAESKLISGRKAIATPLRIADHTIHLMIVKAHRKNILTN